MDPEAGGVCLDPLAHARRHLAGEDRDIVGRAATKRVDGLPRLSGDIAAGCGVLLECLGDRRHTRHRKQDHPPYPQIFIGDTDEWRDTLRDEVSW